MLEDSAQKTVLVVDDDDLIRTLLTYQLKRKYRVVAASSGEEALDRAGSLQTIDLVVTDMIMPGMGGLGLVERLRADGRAKRILIISGSSEPAVVEEYIRDGEVEFLAKPFTAFAFGAAVEKMMAGRAANASGAGCAPGPSWDCASPEAA